MNLTLPPLPYAHDALEPYISRRTLAVHHGNHHAAYVAKTRALIQRTPLESAASLEDVVRSSTSQEKALFNAAAQAWNHGFYWQSMRPRGGGEAKGAQIGSDREHYLTRVYRSVQMPSNQLGAPI